MDRMRGRFLATLDSRHSVLSVQTILHYNWHLQFGFLCKVSIINELILLSLDFRPTKNYAVFIRLENSRL